MPVLTINPKYKISASGWITAGDSTKMQYYLQTFPRKGQVMIGRIDRLWRRSSAKQASSVRRVVLFGLFGSGNSGNDASLEAMLTFLRRWPGMDITCVCYAPDAI